MDLSPVSHLRAALAIALADVVAAPVYNDEITSVARSDGTNVPKFFTVFFSGAEETEIGEHLDSGTYKTRALLTIGCHWMGADQAVLDGVGGAVRDAVMNVAFSGDIKRDGWDYVPGTDGATPGIQLRFVVEYSN